MTVKLDAEALYDAVRAVSAAHPPDLNGNRWAPLAAILSAVPSMSEKRAKRMLERWDERGLVVIASGWMVRPDATSPRRLDAAPGGKQHVSCVWIIKRGPRPDWYHASVPHHPVIVTGRPQVAKREAGWSGDGATVWEQTDANGSAGCLIVRWQGLVIDYGHIVRGFTLPNGEACPAFQHDRSAEPWTLLNGAVWMDDRVLPDWLDAAGAVYPPDHWTRRAVLETVARDGLSGFGREALYPPFWPVLPSEGGSQLVPSEGRV